MALPEKPDIKTLYETYGPSVYRRCRMILRNDAAAQDAFHDVFIKVCERYDSFRGDASPLTWLIRIATNHCLNIVRAKQAAWHDRYRTTVMTQSEEAPDEAARLERTDLVSYLLPKLDQQSVEAAIYTFVDGMRQEEAAAAAGCSVPTYRKRLRKFIKGARKILSTVDVDAVFGPPPV